MPISPDQSNVFEAYEHLFMSEGWKMFVEDIKKNKESLFPQLMKVDSTDEVLWFCKGRNDVYTYILGLQPLVEAARKQLEDEERSYE